MERATALAIFSLLEAEHDVDPDDAEWKPVRYQVRLDAGADRDEQRTYRVRVSPASDTADWLAVAKLAKQHKATVTIDNNAMELR